MERPTKPPIGVREAADSACRRATRDNNAMLNQESGRWDARL
jgi:hypothetical protein